ncbi:MAG: hypothetical protein ACI9X4_001744 [Glaciecola sp.]|jgi:uncharacterized protein (DUF885 family)
MLQKYFLLALLGLTACGSLLRPDGGRKELSPNEPTRLHNFLDEVYATGTDRARVAAALGGSDIQVAIWDSLDPEQTGRVQGWLLDCKQRLDGDFQATRTTEVFRFEKAAARQWIRWELAEQEWDAHRILLSDAEGLHRLPARYLWQTMRPESLQDWQGYVSLLEQLPIHLGQLEANLRACGDRQTLPPKQVLRRARTVCLNWLAGRPFAALSSSESPWLSQAYAALDQSQALTPADRTILRDAIDRALTQKVGPAYQQLATTLDEMRRLAPAEAGAWARKDGLAWYAYRLSRIAGESTAPDDLHALGLAEVDRLHAQLSEALRTLGTPTQTDYYLESLREGDNAAYATEETWLLDVQASLEVAHQRCLPLFPAGELPTMRVDVGTNLATAQLLPLQYMPGRVPRIEIFPGTWSGVPRSMIPAWTFAQGVPGEHLRTQITQAQTSIPKLLRTMDLPSMQAGWRLYATRLASEFQMYSGPKDEVGQILLELWHAACLVTDTGLHSQEWSLAQAESYLQDNSCFPRAICVQTARDSVERPGILCAATIGLNQIADLREQTQVRLGPTFNPNAFHRAFLEKSVFPIKQVREAIMLWSLEQL